MTTPAFQNIYYKRTAATAKSCFICYRPTTTVLATINTLDFFYACDGHLNDYGFASKIESPLPSSNVKKMSDEEILKIKEEWEEKQKRKQDKAKAEADKGEKGEKEKATERKEGNSLTPKSPPPPPAPIPVPGQTVPAKPVHEKYALHRDIWGMRQDEHRKRRQTAAAKHIAPRLPSAPQRRL